MKKILLLIILAIGCTENIGVIEDEKAEAPELQLAKYSVEENSTQFKYWIDCGDCKFVTEGETLSYRITENGKLKDDKSFYDRGKFGCYDGCKSNFIISFNKDYFTQEYSYEIEVFYTMSETDCFNETTISNEFLFTY